MVSGAGYTVQTWACDHPSVILLQWYLAADRKELWAFHVQLRSCGISHVSLAVSFCSSVAAGYITLAQQVAMFLFLNFINRWFIHETSLNLCHCRVWGSVSQYMLSDSVFSTSVAAATLSGWGGITGRQRVSSAHYSMWDVRWLGEKYVQVSESCGSTSAWRKWAWYWRWRESLPAKLQATLHHLALRSFLQPAAMSLSLWGAKDNCAGRGTTRKAPS